MNNFEHLEGNKKNLEKDELKFKKVERRITKS